MSDLDKHVSSFLAQLKANPMDGQLRRIAADAFEEAGREAEAEVLRDLNRPLLFNAAGNVALADDLWTYPEPVAILDETTLEDPQGNGMVDITPERLAYIAQLANQRAAQTGDLIPIVIGHTTDDTPEVQQPEIVGYASGLFVDDLFKTGRKAVKATFQFLKDKLDVVKKFPRRSVELWLRDWKIDPISLLGATTPERDLGLLRFDARGRHVFRLQGPRQVQLQLDRNSGDKTMPDDFGKKPDDEKEKMADAAAGESSVAKELESIMPQLKKLAEMTPAIEELLGAATADPMADPMGGAMPPMDPMGGMPPMDPMGGEQPVQQSAASPGGSNTHVPGMLNESRLPPQGGKPDYNAMLNQHRLPPQGAKPDYNAMLNESRLPPGGGKQQYQRRPIDRAKLQQYLKQRAEQQRQQLSRQTATGGRRPTTTTSTRETMDVVKLQRQNHDLNVRLQRLERENQASRLQLGKLATEKVNAEIENELNKMKTEGVVFDHAEETERLRPLPQEQREGHYKLMRQHYQKNSPADRPVYHTGGLTPQGHGTNRPTKFMQGDQDKARLQRMVRKAQAEGKTFEQVQAEEDGALYPQDGA